MLSRLGERLEGTLAPEAVLPAIVDALREALKLPYAAIELPRDGGFEVVTASPARSRSPSGSAELGGECEIVRSFPSGTRVFASLPLGEPQLEGLEE